MTPESSELPEVQRVLAQELVGHPVELRQDVEASLAAVIAVGGDMRYIRQTIRAVLRQSVLPCLIVVADPPGASHP